MHKDKQKPCRFFVVPGESPALLGMMDVETLELVSVNCNMIELDWMNRQSKEQKMQAKSSTNKYLTYDTANGIKCNNIIDYFLAVPDKEAVIERSAKLAKSIQQELADIFWGSGYVKGKFSLKEKMHLTIPCTTKVCILCTAGTSGHNYKACWKPIDCKEPYALSTRRRYKSIRNIE